MAINTLGAPRRAPQRGRDFQRQPYQRYHRPLPRTPGSWRPSNLPSPMNVAGRKVAEKIAGKVLLRFIPVAGTLLLAWDLYEWLNGTQKSVPGTTHYTCSHTNVGAFLSLGRSSSSHSHVACNTNGAVWSTSGIPQSTTIQTTTLFPYVQTYHAHRTIADRYLSVRCENLGANQSARYGAIPVPRYAPGIRPKPWQQPGWEPWFDPSIPPQFQKPPKPYRGFKPDPKFVPGRVGPRIDPKTDPRDIDPGDIVGPTIPRPGRTRPRPRVRVKPRIPPWWDPFPQPRVPVPQPLEDPPPWPDTRPGPGVAPAPGPVPGFGGVPSPGPQSPPPGYEVIIDPGVRTDTRLRPRPPSDTALPAPPKAGDRETKIGMNQLGYGWVLWLFNFTTEANDFLQAMKKALPCEVQRKFPKDANLPVYANLIYAYWDQIDWLAAVNELFLNFIEDQAVGKTKRAINKGFGTGQSWKNYLKALELSKATDYMKSFGKNIDRGIDFGAESLGLHRVHCGRKR